MERVQEKGSQEEAERRRMDGVMSSGRNGTETESRMQKHKNRKGARCTGCQKRRAEGQKVEWVHGLARNRWLGSSISGDEGESEAALPSQAWTFATVGRPSLEHCAWASWRSGGLPVRAAGLMHLTVGEGRRVAEAHREGAKWAGARCGVFGRGSPGRSGAGALGGAALTFGSYREGHCAGRIGLASSWRWIARQEQRRRQTSR